MKKLFSSFKNKNSAHQSYEALNQALQDRSIRKSDGNAMLRTLVLYMWFIFTNSKMMAFDPHPLLLNDPFPIFPYYIQPLRIHSFFLLFRKMIYSLFSHVLQCLWGEAQMTV